MPGRGHLPAQPLLGSGAAGRSRRTSDKLGAAPRGARGAAAAMCRRGNPPSAQSPRPPPPGAEGASSARPAARAQTGAGTRVGEGRARRKDATASRNTFPCLERKRSEEREKG